MDSLRFYRAKIKDLLAEIERFERQTSGSSAIETLSLIDETRDRYMLYRVGWERHGRVSSTAVFIRIIEGTVWIEEDWTQPGVARRLMEAGIPQADIRFGFHPPMLRDEAAPAVA